MYREGKNGKIYLAVLLAFICMLESCTNNSAINTKPNILFIMTDDMGYETVGFNKVVNFKTPHIDKLSTESFVFTNCDAQPLCVPTRVKLMTGQYNYRNYRGWGGFDLEFPPIGKMLREAGYVTGVFGKWHLGKSPQDLGFDKHCYFDGSPGELEYFEFYKRYFYNTPLIEDGVHISASYAPDKFNHSVLKFIDDHGGGPKPFFIYYPLSLAHNPFEPTPDSKDPSSKNWQRNFEDMVNYADKMIGKVIDKLKSKDLYENTIIFYTSDNGTKTLAHEMDNGEVIYGGKGIQMNDGCHVPLLIKYNGSHKLFDDLVDFTDFYPTLTSLAEIPLDQLSDRLDGISLHSLLQGKNNRHKPYIFSVFHHPLSAYIRDKRYKFYFDGRLYDLVVDPRELNPFYDCNDIRNTKQSRNKLKGQLNEIVNDKQLSTYKTKKQLFDAFGDYKAESRQQFLIRSFIFNDLEYTPTKEKLSLDITKYIEDMNQAYYLKFERGMGKPNSGLAYADVKIEAIRLRKNERMLWEKKNAGIELITRRDVDNLRKKGNPIIAFKRSGDNSVIPMGIISKPVSEKIELEIDIELSNPGNQWGDRLLLSVFLDKVEVE